jgi:hypothetical protein
MIQKRNPSARIIIAAKSPANRDGAARDAAKLPNCTLTATGEKGIL